MESLSDVSVLGITDYFSVDGYRAVKAFKKSGRLGNIDLVLPNLELRLDSKRRRKYAVDERHSLFLNL